MAQRLLRMLAGASRDGDPVGDYIARYTMDATDGADDTGTWDGTWDNTPASVTGVLNNGNDGSSTSARLLVSSFPTHANASPVRTYSGWIQFKAIATATGTTATAQYVNNQVGGISIYTYKNGIRIGLSSSNAGIDMYYYSVAFSTVMSLDTWYHLTIVTDGVNSTSGTMTIYIDGSDVTSSFSRTVGSGSNSATTADLKINDAINATRLGKCWYDDTRFYDRALSSTEVGNLYAWYDYP